MHRQEIGAIGPEVFEPLGRFIEEVAQPGSTGTQPTPPRRTRPGPGARRPGSLSVRARVRPPNGRMRAARGCCLLGARERRRWRARRRPTCRLADVRGQPILIGAGDDLEPALDLQEDAAGEINVPLVPPAAELVGVEPALKGRGTEVELMAVRECQPALLLREWDSRQRRLVPGSRGPAEHTQEVHLVVHPDRQAVTAPGTPGPGTWRTGRAGPGGSAPGGRPPGESGSGHRSGRSARGGEGM